MPAPLFDSYLIVDWSAAGVPRSGRDSIWIAHATREAPRARLENPPSRLAAIARIAAILDGEAAAGRRVLAGFDFPFGYPAGTARRIAGRDGWEAVWDALAEVIREGDGNANNRFEAAAALNARISGGSGPFWGNGLKRDIPGLPRTLPEGFGERLPARKRAAERHLPTAQEVWKLSGAGSVGGQALTGIAALARLRRQPSVAPHIRVWPFETGLAVPDAAIVLAEVYPSLLRPDPREPVRDAGQVRAVAEHFRVLDAAGRLARLFAGPASLTPEERRAIETEEAWPLGAGFEAELRAPAAAPARRADPRPRLRYERDPAAIYRQSFATVRAESRLDHLPEDLHEVAIRLVHACGMPDVANRLAWSADLAPAARTALAAGAPILCDCEAVASGIVHARLPAANPVICTLNNPATPALADSIANTRSAAAVELWRDHLAGALAVIGNAPTALFHLLELIDAGWPRPAAILAFPVGFVGAAESKAELARNPRGIPFLTLRGRRGGSGLAAAAVNALAAGLEAPR